MSTNFRNLRVEFHILQSFPVTCLNRDDVGAPKTAMVGGVRRARVSSQSWKRQVRMAMQDFGVKLGKRTKNFQFIMKPLLINAGAEEEEAKNCADALAESLAKDTLLFTSDTEAEKLTKLASEKGFDADKLKGAVSGFAKKEMKSVDALDIVLFGRMVAQVPEMKVEAAASFSHAISTHQVSNELDFFTALDDYPDEDSDSSHVGSSHMGTLEYSSATYYRYVSLDLGQMAQTLGENEGMEDYEKAIDAFTRALFVAVPNARQTTMSGASPWEFARVLVRKGQRLQVPFDQPVKPEKGGGYLQPSINALKEYLSGKEKMAGSLFGKVACHDWGEDENFSIDDLIANLQAHLRQA